jgi:hypothetical protein
MSLYLYNDITTSTTSPPADGSIDMLLYLSPYIGANRLFHIVGHECKHLKQYTSGRYAIWVVDHGAEGARARTEIEATWWNIFWILHGISYNGALKNRVDYLKEWIDVFEECCT